ncbi:MAG TPA: hypothetical protein VFI29_01680, partial [Hanamia sp.]|nr:hypothetical protein [Hanamia sp.]
EFQRLKEDENDRLKLEWNLQRTLSKINYRIHTDAIKENLIPKELDKLQINFVYASSIIGLFNLCNPDKGKTLTFKVNIFPHSLRNSFVG